MSPDSLDVAAELGAAMATFVQFPIEQHAPLIETYREAFRQKQGREAPAPTLTEFVYCSEDPEEAKQTATEYISRYFIQVMRHYEFGGTHFSGTAGYESYSAVAEIIRDAGQEASAAAYVDAQTWGTPEQIIETIKALGGADQAISLAVSPRAFEQAYGTLRRGGKLVFVALPADNQVTLPIFETVLNGITVVGSIVGTRTDLREVFELHAAGKTRVIREVRPLARVNESIADVEAGRVAARIVFAP